MTDQRKVFRWLQWVERKKTKRKASSKQRGDGRHQGQAKAFQHTEMPAICQLRWTYSEILPEYPPELEGLEIPMEGRSTHPEMMDSTCPYCIPGNLESRNNRLSSQGEKLQSTLRGEVSLTGNTSTFPVERWRSSFFKVLSERQQDKIRIVFQVRSQQVCVFKNKTMKPDC